MNPVRVTVQGAFTDDYREPFYVKNWRVERMAFNEWDWHGVLQWLSWRNRGRIAFRLALV